MKIYLLYLLLLSTSLFSNTLLEFLSLDLQGKQLKTEQLHKSNYYDIKKGWNTFITPKGGLDVAKTFVDAESLFVYDARSKLWAAYSTEASTKKEFAKSQLLYAKYIEPYQTFYLKSSKAMRVGIISQELTGFCKQLLKNSNYELLYDSGRDENFSYNSSKTIALKSRYYLHTRRGIYDDSRVLIITPKIQKDTSDAQIYKYGPAVPKMITRFNKAYQEKTFYAYDFLTNSCHKGIFPSKRRPPAPTMSTLQELHNR